MSDDLKEKAWTALASYLERSPFFQRLLARLVMNSTVVPAKIYPYAESAEAWWTEMVSPPPAGASPEELPVPPFDLWEGYGGRDPKAYLATGHDHTTRMLEILGATGFSLDQATHVLDFGCSAGRMIRWLAPYAEGREIWGVDIASKPIHWATQNLPAFHFVTNTTLPPLPFEAGTFDLVYCGSIFTHIADLAEVWLLELRRLLKPGGLLYATVHDKHTVKLLFEKHTNAGLTRVLRDCDARTGCLQGNFAKLVVARSPKGAQVFYDIEYLRQHWSRLFEIVSVTQEAYGYQTALVLRKR